MPAPTTSIQQLQLLPEDELVTALLSQREGQWFERTSVRTSARHLGDLLVSFANADGGLIVIGIHDGTIEGVAGAGARVNEWRQAAVDFTHPPVRHRLELVPCTGPNGARDELALVEVEPSEHVHENVRGDTLLRIGDENRRLAPTEAQELRYDKGDAVFDGTAVRGASMSDLDDRLVARYARAIHSSSRPEIALTSRGLLVRQRGSLVPSTAGILLLGKDPQAFFPAATVRILKYQGTQPETGTRSNVSYDTRLGGPLPLQIDAARRRLRRWLLPAVRLAAQGRFGATTLIPAFAWLEAVVNAVVHRSYSAAGDHIRIELFDDRLVVESPGRLPGLVRVEQIRTTRFARNPRIARAMADLGYGRELGEGVDRMFQEMERAGLPDPIFSQGPGSVRVTFLADPLSGRVLRYLPQGSERFVEFLQRTGRVTTLQAADLLGISRPTARSYLTRLARVKLLEHVGTNMKDPRGYWRLVRSSAG